MKRLGALFLRGIFIFALLGIFVSGFETEADAAVTRYSTDKAVKAELKSQIAERTSDDDITVSIYLTKGKFTTYYNTRSKFKSLLQKAAIANGVMYDEGSVTYYKSKYMIQATIDLADVYVVSTNAKFYKAAIEILQTRSFDKYIYYEGNDDNAYEMIGAVYRQFPEYNTALLSYAKKTVEGYTMVGFSMQDGYTKSNLKSYYKSALNKAKSIISSEIDDSMTTDEEKVKAIHDYLCNNCKYVSSGDKLNYTAYGCLVNGEATCQGYSGAFNMLLHLCGIRSIAITGKVSGTTNHAWNYAYVDGKYLYYDVTWDDDDTNSKILTTYYGVDASVIGKDHTFDSTYTKYEKMLKYSKYTF
ncbi:MAG: hypothetical protein K6G40_00575 [Eubacterium sp.]|nr:hypothetical protein [Eubacterium sp.]